MAAGNITESHPMKKVAREKRGTHDALQAYKGHRFLRSLLTIPSTLLRMLPFVSVLTSKTVISNDNIIGNHNIK